jgi:hypothetical protein
MMDESFNHTPSTKQAFYSRDSRWLDHWAATSRFTTKWRLKLDCLIRAESSLLSPINKNSL